MNYSALKKQLGTTLRIRPSPLVGLPSPANLELWTDWTLGNIDPSTHAQPRVGKDESAVLSIPADKHLNFDEPDTLCLRSQILLTAKGPAFEPLPVRGGARPGPFCIDALGATRTHHEYLPICGSGAPPGHLVLVFTRLVRERLWLQPGAVEATHEGHWVHPRVHLRASQERHIFALAVPATELARTAAAFTNELRDVSTLEDRLSLADVPYRLSTPILLNRVGVGLPVTSVDS